MISEQTAPERLTPRASFAAKTSEGRRHEEGNDVLTLAKERYRYIIPVPTEEVRRSHDVVCARRLLAGTPTKYSSRRQGGV